ncbi:MAG: demethoxyubiquinone hydroxylase family protein [Xanthomonadales bacterium]|nr:demethoxyubiquinone hydroxylase family protein [Gammaproteobacteria bacterium]MBT8065523.1 demethoxyubiquinone hydroxylase family protein [Gammaproteobacteria bacterium]NNK32876.1 demethoxyubiquinone hydroxylase family protein [Xanthomonadales bacterium]NNK38479.1 demethoxyubiquinone hydroxylase family protein [Xanthomonadales bacterium]
MQSMKTRPVPPFNQLPLSDALKRDLRSNHAGEVGAVEIYRGILAVSRDDAVRRFAVRHLVAEQRHRRFFDSWLPGEWQSRLLKMWRAAGWSLGAVSALFGSRAVFRTIEAVESFVEIHYRDQIEAMSEKPALAQLSRRLQEFCDDEVEHRLDAARRSPAVQTGRTGAWSRLVGWGSAVGVAVARRV